MEKINQTVLQHESSSTQENLLTEMDDAELIQQLKVKLSRIKMPPNKHHIKNKLSTVIEESFTQSEKTSLKMVTPRDFFMDLHSESPGFLAQEIEEAMDPVQKKITGIRKATSLKSTLAANSPIRKNN